MKIIILTSGGDVASLSYNALIKKGVHVSEVIQDIEFNKWLLIKKRIKKFGYSKVMGQLLFQTMIVKFLNFRYAPYIKELKTQYGISDLWKTNTIKVRGINSEESINIIQKINPELILLAGTKILSKNFLSHFNCPIINVHVGVTPKYRGVHGGYWALVNKDSQNLGVTVHFVDAGIDTGGVIKQSIVSMSAKDSFVTYGLKQLKQGVEDLTDVVIEYLNTTDIKLKKTKSYDSKLYSHPTAWEYLINLILKGVK
jgi:folate-dependent phosphoribosylglycinamide formyltransferase PurN